MAILVHPDSRHDAWRVAFEPLLAGEDLRWWPDVGEPSEIEYLIAWVMRRSDLATLTNLEAILSLGAGAEQWQKPGMPDVPIVRLADPAMAREMAAFALAWVLRHQRRFATAEQLQRSGRWSAPTSTPTSEFRVGILGFGTIGQRIGQAFGDLGFPVNAWTRSRRESSGVSNFVGLPELDDFLTGSDAVINALPSTPATTGLLDPSRLAAFAEGSIFVNVGRGTVLSSEVDLVHALDSGPLAAAVLDVTNPEPPAGDSPLFAHPAVTLTAHTSGITQIATASRVIADNVARLRRGEAPFPLLDRDRSY